MKAMEMAQQSAKPDAKDHLNWELIGEAAKKIKGAEGKALKEAHEQVQKEEDEHRETKPEGDAVVIWTAQ